MGEIVTLKPGTAIADPRSMLSPDQVDLIARTIAKGATPDELKKKADHDAVAPHRTERAGVAQRRQAHGRVAGASAAPVRATACVGCVVHRRRDPRTGRSGVTVGLHQPNRELVRRRLTCCPREGCDPTAP